MPYSYAIKTSSLKEFLQKIKNKELGVPRKVTYRYLESIGYKSKNDRRIVSVLKSIGFLDDTGKPTQRFRDFRTKPEQVMAEALRQTYSELFQTYPEPYKKARKELEDFFAKDTDLKKATLGMMADTFNLLCEFADFKAVAIPPKEKVKEAEKKAAEAAKVTTQMPTGVTINLNIQLTLPATEDATVYDKIFKALKENLLSPD